MIQIKTMEHKLKSARECLCKELPVHWTIPRSKHHFISQKALSKKWEIPPLNALCSKPVGTYLSSSHISYDAV